MSRGALTPLDEVLMGQRTIEAQEGTRTQHDGKGHHAPRTPGPRAEGADLACGSQARDDQREGTRRQHHARAEAEQRVLGAVREALREQNRQGAGGGREVYGLRERGFDAIGYEPVVGFEEGLQRTIDAMLDPEGGTR